MGWSVGKVSTVGGVCALLACTAEITQPGGSAEPPPPVVSGWWSTPPSRPALPQVTSAAWVRQPLDAFVLAQLEPAGLAPQPEADRLLEDTLVIWGGEFGRTVFSQGELTKETYGRDHHPGCFTMWMAGAGIKPGISYGETDEFGYNVVSGGVPLRNLHATLLHQFGLDHDRLSVLHQGLFQKLVGVDAPAQVVDGLLA